MNDGNSNRLESRERLPTPKRVRRRIPRLPSLISSEARSKVVSGKFERTSAALSTRSRRVHRCAQLVSRRPRDAGIRPENIALNQDGVPANVHPATVEVVEPQGEKTVLELELETGQSIKAAVDPDTTVEMGDAVNLRFDRDSLHVFRSRLGDRHVRREASNSRRRSDVWLWNSAIGWHPRLRVCRDCVRAGRLAVFNSLTGSSTVLYGMDDFVTTLLVVPVSTGR